LAVLYHVSIIARQWQGDAISFRVDNPLSPAVSSIVFMKKLSAFALSEYEGGRLGTRHANAWVQLLSIETEDLIDRSRPGVEAVASALAAHCDLSVSRRERCAGRRSCTRVSYGGVNNSGTAG
jgi:hypothetical protein